MELFQDETISVLAGFRLQYLEVLNWGTFHKKRWQIEPSGDNALLTGDIGSGKSTLVDALTCLLVPHNKIIFNKAAGAEGKERSLLSYVKGEYKKEKEEITKSAKKIYLRPNDDTYTVIIGDFFNKGYSETVCLAQLFWIGKEGKVEKLLIISSIPLTIANDFSGFTDINELRKKLRHKEGVILVTDNFSQYSEQFRRLFGMNSDKAIDLFYQTVSMKSVSSLTDFVREQMLEKTDVKDQIGALLKRFDDLNKSHAAVVHAREQFQILKPLTEDVVAYGEVNREIEHIEAMLELIPAWFAIQKKTLLDEEIATTTDTLELATQVTGRLMEQKEELENKKLGILQDIDNNGGKRLEQIAMEIRQQEKDRDIKKSDYDDYEKLVRACKFPVVENEADFSKNIERAKAGSEVCLAQERTLRQERDTVVSELRKLETEMQLEQKELQSLKERKTQVPSWLIGFRWQLCSDLDINDDELPFMGELLKVAESETAWEGAIEKLLHDAGISLLVPKEHYKSVSRYVNDNVLRSPDGRGIKITYLEADLDKLTQVSRRLEGESVVYKLEIKPDTQFFDWLDNHLQRSFGDFVCVDVQTLQHVPFGITKQGLIKSGKIRHTKDDRRRLDDKRNYVLGWSNVEKIKVLEQVIDELEIEIEQLRTEKAGIEKQQSENDSLKQQLSHLLTVRDFSRIDWRFHTEKIHELATERFDLLNNNDLLSLLNQKKAEVEEETKDVNQKLKEKIEEVGRLKEVLRTYSELLLGIAELISQIDPKRRDAFFPIIEEKMTDKQLRLSSIDKQHEQFRKLFEGDSGELKRMRHRLSTLRSAVERRMREIKEHSRAEYSEISESIDARGEYLQKFERLVNEDLKRHEERFKEELNKNTINSISVFDNKLEQHEKDIKQKIKTINQHLYEIVYNSSHDTYITILMDATPKKEIRLFKEELKKCYIHSFSSNSELYTEEKYEQVKTILDRFASSDPIDKEWTNTVTDVRQWFEFNASERYRASDEEKEFYEGSGGKSGGQKEKLAYTILASALAFQFGLQFGESKSRSFRFVVIDEAFGRGSDESTRYGLELFKKLNLQLLIVTPLQKIHIIEGHVNSFHFVSNRDGDNSQVSNFTKKEYLLEKSRYNSVFKSETAQA
ncbi:ATP-binding protein [Flaviaesturariibacter amylovorans]|uniref:ATP-binding protein n=1 Tax=Flaviaesturariibacter amylovorans TaxID=1084520 RepID=A0ABP8H603_9BACT